MIFVPVIGAPRSGTSCVAGVLRRLGVYFGEDDEMQATDDNNPRGYNELAIAHFPNNAILRTLGLYTWWQPPPCLDYFNPKEHVVSPALLDNRAPYARPAIRFILNSLDQRTTTGFVGIKDVRLVFSLSVWLQELNVNALVKPVVVMRDEEAEVRSWVRAGFTHDENAARVALKRYYDWIQQITGSMDTCVVKYEELLADPRGQITRLAEWVAPRGYCEVKQYEFWDCFEDNLEDALDYVSPDLNRCGEKGTTDERG